MGFNVTNSTNGEDWYNGGLTLGSDGYYYGTNTYAHSGANRDLKENTRGFFYRIHPTSYKTEILHEFENNDELFINGSFDNHSSLKKELGSPILRVVEKSPGVFYGVAAFGGANGYGGIWKYTLSTKKYLKIGDFDDTSIGHTPVSNLITVGNYLYGVVSVKNSLDIIGHLYRINTTTDQLEYYHDLADNSPIGVTIPAHDRPRGDIIYNATSGKIYGTHVIGISLEGNWGGGVWEIKLSTNEVRNKVGIRWDELDVLGSHMNGIVVGGNGNYYCITKNGGAYDSGTILLFDRNSNAFFKIFDFPIIFPPGGAYSLTPSGVGLKASETKIYGVYNYPGGIWSYDLLSHQFTNEAATGHSTDNNFIITGNTIIGHAGNGGTNNAGYFFKQTVGGANTEIILDNASTKGRNIIGEITQLDNNTAVVAIAKGGAADTHNPAESAEQGMLAILNLTTKTFTELPNSTLYYRNENYESFVANRVLKASNNKLYYSIFNNIGSNGVEVMRLMCYDMNTQTATMVYTFQNDTSELIGLVEVNNKLYAAFDSSMYVIDPTTNTILETIVTHDASLKGNMYGNLLTASNGKIYGLTFAKDNTSVAAIYSFDPATKAFNIVHEMAGATKTMNIGLNELNGKLYGSSNYEGSSQNGYLFSFDINTSQFNIEHNFDYSTDGSNFQAMWTPNNGKLYSTSYTGGQNGYGTLVSFDPGSSTFTTIEHLTINNGRSFRGSPMVINANLSNKKFENPSATVKVYPNPTKNIVNVALDQVDKIEVFTIQGAKVKEVLNQKEVDLKTFSKGIYILKIHSNKQIFSKEVIKD